MPEFRVDVWYDTPARRGAIWDEVASAPDSARAVEVVIKHFTNDHIPGLNVTEVHVKQMEDSEGG